LLEDKSRNTRENAVFSKEIIDRYDCGQPLLVTSIAHMPRAVATFEKFGINVFPVSTDVRAYYKESHTVMDYLPDAEALEMTTNVMREWLGRKVYAWRGWN
ncbi:MAG: YdcF family protein, partial [Gammaproteobacteria bacterium]|nr:YdcF family protein [Gammaproteobacteria bacterium]